MIIVAVIYCHTHLDHHDHRVRPTMDWKHIGLFGVSPHWGQDDFNNWSSSWSCIYDDNDHDSCATDVFFKVDTWAGAQAVCDNLGGFLVETRLVKDLDFFQDTVCFQRATFESLASLEALVSTTVAACSNFLGFQSFQQQCAAVSRQLLLQYYRFNVKLQHHEISYNMQIYAIPTRPYDTGQYVNITIWRIVPSSYDHFSPEVLFLPRTNEEASLLSSLAMVVSSIQPVQSWWIGLTDSAHEGTWVCKQIWIQSKYKRKYLKE